MLLLYFLQEFQKMFFHQLIHFVPSILNVALVGLLIPTTTGLFPCAATSSLYALLVNTHFSD